ncbi:heme-binding protein 2-like [Ambystoma mexicanum]|uniref:heme-binding protein 2-like n=1 Tax=Ambystoma mexicanum TaxID=8296 RepID=UPI0037E99094
MAAPGLALLVFLALGIAGVHCESQKPDFCAEVQECFAFTLLCNGTDYQARVYPPSTWVGTRVTATYTRAKLTGFWRLLSYIQGQNEEGVKIEVTAPVITRVPLGSDVEKEYAVYFLLPVVHQEAPPIPTSPDVFFSRFPEMVVYVRSFGGWIINSNRDFHSKALDTSLRENGEDFTPDYYYTAGYNGPMKLFNRHNEIWFRGSGVPRCGGLQE